MRKLALLVAMSAALALGGCDSLPDFVKPLLKRVLNPTDVAKGAFTGAPKVILLEPKTAEDRSVQLIEPFGFKDSAGTEWMAPAGFVSDGASIPWELWTFIGGPFDGPYRDAAILHDYYCEKRDRSWEAVHKMFLEAALRRGVPESRAQTMYAGVLYGGPRWDEPKPLTKAQIAPSTGGASKPAVDPGITKRGPTDAEKKQFEDLRRWIEQTKPTPEQIKQRVEEMRRAKGMPTTTK